MSSRKLYIVGGGATNIPFRGPDGRPQAITLGEKPKELPECFLQTGTALAFINAGQLLEVGPAKDSEKEGAASVPSGPPAEKKKPRGKQKR